MIANDAEERRVEHLAGSDVVVEEAWRVAHDVAAVGAEHLISFSGEPLQRLPGVGHYLPGEEGDVGFRSHLHVGVHHKGVAVVVGG